MPTILAFFILLQSANLPISVRFVDATDEQTIEGVMVLMPDGARFYSDASGWVRLPTTSEQDSIRYFAHGYKTGIVAMSNLYPNTVLRLERLSVQGREVTVVAQFPSRPGEHSISNRRIAEMPAFLGQRDVLKLIQRLPTVTAGLEGSSDVLVKGGNRGQNLVMFHDIPLRRVSHAGGLVSILSADAIGSTRFFSAHVPVEFGNSVSSVLHLLPREREEGASSVIETGLLTAGATLEHPNLLMGYRRNTFNQHLNLLDRNDTYTFPNSTFQDGFMQVRWGGPASRWYLTGIGSQDTETANDRFSTETETRVIRVSQDDENGWSQVGMSLSNRRTMDRMVLQSGIVLSRLWQNTDWERVTVGATTFTQRFHVRNGLRKGIAYSTLRSGGFTAGLGVETSRYIYDAAYSEQTQKTVRDEGSSEFTAYGFASYEAGIGRFMRWNAGIRPVWLQSQEKIAGIQPRVLFTFPIRTSTLHVGVARLIQETHVAPTPGFSTTQDLIFPASRDLPVQVSTTAFLGFDHSVPVLGRLTWEAYMRWYEQVLDFRPGTSLLSPFDALSNVLITGDGRAHGVSASFAGAKDAWEWNAQFSWSHSERQFEERNGGEEYRSRYDRPILFNADLRYAISSKWTLHSAFTLTSGHLVTLPTGLQTGVSNPPEPQFGFKGSYWIVDGVNGERLPLYHRLDIGTSYKPDRYQWLDVSFGVFNLYNRLNPQDVRFYAVVGNKAQFTSIYLFPFTPYLSVRCAF